MNYYIKGDAAKADQIKAAFRAKGISDGGNSFIHGNYLYFSEGGEVDFCGIGGHVANIILTHPDYKELELAVKPKFEVGNWIVRWDDAFTISIKSVRDENYYFHQGGSLPIKEVDEYYHLWSIADANDGDVLTTDNGWTCIFKAFDGYVLSSYCFMDSQKWFCEVGSEAHTLDSRINGNILPATKEQRDLLFKKMKEAGYEWDKNKKELRKIQPHYDIANFHAGMPVLVRIDNSHKWNYTLFSHYNEGWNYPFCVAGCSSIKQCIPFNYDTKHLLGTTDMCDEQYINW